MSWFIYWLNFGQLGNMPKKMSIPEMRIPRWMRGDAWREKIRNECFRGKLEVASVEKR